MVSDFSLSTWQQDWMSSTVLQDALLVLGAAVVELLLKLRNFEATRQLLTQEQAIGQYVLYRLLLEQVDPERELYLAVANTTFDEIFSEPIGELVMQALPMKLLIVDVEAVEVKRWIPARESGTL